MSNKIKKKVETVPEENDSDVAVEEHPEYVTVRAHKPAFYEGIRIFEKDLVQVPWELYQKGAKWFKDPDVPLEEKPVLTLKGQASVVREGGVIRKAPTRTQLVGPLVSEVVQNTKAGITNKPTSGPKIAHD